MTTKPASLAEQRRDSDEQDSPPSASARFRLKMTADGQLVPEIVPVDDAAESSDSEG
ncbi:MAG: hypothetical protein AAF799_39425 [Myxococcota bacterium]